MNRWIQHGCTVLAAAAVALAGGSSYAQDVKGQGAATVQVKPAQPPGALEKTGKAADKALDKAGEKLDKAGEKIDEKADKAGEKIDKAAEKIEEKADKAAEKIEEKAEKAAEKAEAAAEKVGDAAERKKAQIIANAKADREALRVKVKSALKGQPMSEAMKQELKRHARRLARLERIKAVAQTEKDDAATARVDKLIEKENARHNKWMVSFDAKADVKAGAK
jgi:hypothetical protein